MPAGAQNGAVGSQQQQAGAVNGLIGQHQQQQRAGGGPLQPFNGQQSTAPWKAPWQQEVNKPVQHRCNPLLLPHLSHLPRLASIGTSKQDVLLSLEFLCNPYSASAAFF